MLVYTYVRMPLKTNEKNGQGKVDDFERHFHFSLLVDVDDGTFSSYWRGKFLFFFPRNLSTSSSVDDRPQYSAYSRTYVEKREEGFFVSSSSRSPLHRNQMTGGTHGERTSRNFGDASAHCNV